MTTETLQQEIVALEHEAESLRGKKNVTAEEKKRLRRVSFDLTTKRKKVERLLAGTMTQGALDAVTLHDVAALLTHLQCASVRVTYEQHMSGGEFHLTWTA